MSDLQAPVLVAKLVDRINENLEIAMLLVKAAKASVDAGDAARALAMLRDVEPPLFEVTTLLNAASLMRGNHHH